MRIRLRRSILGLLYEDVDGLMCLRRPNKLMIIITLTGKIPSSQVKQDLIDCIMWSRLDIGKGKYSKHEY